MKDGDSGQAFPGGGDQDCKHCNRGTYINQSECPRCRGTGRVWAASPGMTLREYACIKLKVPATGHEWLDELIQKSLLNDFAAQAMLGILSTEGSLAAISATAQRNNESNVMAAADIAYDHAGAMLKRTTRPAADESTND